MVSALLSPLWFFTIAGVNLNPADLVLLFVSISFVARTGLLPYSLTRVAWLAIIVFLGVAGISILWSTNRVGALLSITQYLFIFLAVVPIVSYALRERSTRWHVFLSIWGATTALTFLGIYTYVVGDLDRLREITLWYGNQNQFFWLVASACLCSVALTLEESAPLGLRLVAATLATTEVALVFGGMTLSAILMAGGGLWLFAAWLAQRHARPARIAFATATLAACVAALAVVVNYWDYVYIQASLHVRIPQYTTAIWRGIQHFPLGMGIDAYYPSVHNFFLNYFVEVGIVGATAFLILVLVWCRDVALRSLRHPLRVQPFEFAFVALFGTYVLVILFQPVPVRRFWWILFAASWAVVQDRLKMSLTPW
mgnify:CR=1 FL=1